LGVDGNAFRTSARDVKTHLFFTKEVLRNTRAHDRQVNENQMITILQTSQNFLRILGKHLLLAFFISTKKTEMTGIPVNLHV
jgi:hypothetical protein